MNQPRRTDFGFGKDEALITDSARHFLDQKASIETIRKLVAFDHKDAYEALDAPVYHDNSLWNEIVELGWTVPDAAGGLGINRAHGES